MFDTIKNGFKPVRAEDRPDVIGGSPKIFLTLPAPANRNEPFVAAEPLHASYKKWGKRVFDIILVIASLPVSLPLIALFALALWVEGGNPFYRQLRVGRGGKVFSIVKLRTMVRDADQQLAILLEAHPERKAEWEHSQKLKNDPRITPIGRLLRATSMDELPQLWNVLTGEMSLVGPRPMLPAQVALYGNPQTYYALTPGITGPWQVSARNESSFAFRAVMDRSYFRELSALTDLTLLLRTIGVVLRRTGH